MRLLKDPSNIYLILSACLKVTEASTWALSKVCTVKGFMRQLIHEFLVEHELKVLNSIKHVANVHRQKRSHQLYFLVRHKFNDLCPIIKKT